MERTNQTTDEFDLINLQKLKPTRIIADGDLDGVASVAILLRAFPNVEVVFAHPPGIRSGVFDKFIDKSTIICDLPSHPSAGAVIDHHLTNQISYSEVLNLWRPTMSAARIAHSIVKTKYKLDDLDDFIEWVDRLDGGGISKEEFLSNHPIITLSRSVDALESPSTALWIAKSISEGVTIEEILNNPIVNKFVQKKSQESKTIDEIINTTLRIENRLAVVRFDGTGTRTGGYRITATVGEACDACVIIHGEEGGSISGKKPPLAASFYTNSFLHKNGGVVDLTLLATAFDGDGGGHANACGCRIIPLDKFGMIENREPSVADIDDNISRWMAIWDKHHPNF